MNDQASTYLEQPKIPLSNHWLIAKSGDRFQSIADRRLTEFKDYHRRTGTPANILLAEPEPVAFLATFLAAVISESPVILGNPNWAIAEWQQVFNRIKPDLKFGNIPDILDTNNSRSHLPPASILIPTGGTSGTVKFAVHTWETLAASADGFRQYFERSQIDSFCVLPLFHVGGLMQFVRSLTSGGRLVIFPWRSLMDGNYPELDISDFFISLVPTQLHRLLQHPKTANWLSKFATVLLGGSPPWPELLNQTRSHQIRLSPTYGMTETASGVVTLKPEEFLAGNNTTGRTLPHAKVIILDDSEKPLKSHQTGRISIQSKSLTQGYNTDIDAEKITQLITDDLGYFDDRGYLTIVGRRGDKIITGGENVFPAEVEAAILATGLVADVCVVGKRDRDWGEVVTAVYVPQNRAISVEMLKNAIGDRLSGYKRPKHWISVEKLPRNDRGKINRKLLMEQIVTCQSQKIEPN
ncbi:MAG: 2-succinylbenzoate--CoA ligase [Limnospira sp.]